MTDGRQRKTRADKIPQEVHEQAFALWYKLGKPEWKQLHEVMVKEIGAEKIPTVATLMTWFRTEAWQEHADVLDGNIEIAQDKEIIKQRQDIIKHLADVGKNLVDMGMDYLKTRGLENSADAIRAIGKGAELQDKLLGWAAVFAELSTASDEELDKKLKKYMTGDILEATAINAEPDDTEKPE
jgi:hypothetical protein